MKASLKGGVFAAEIRSVVRPKSGINQEMMKWMIKLQVKGNQVRDKTKDNKTTKHRHTQTCQYS